MISGSAAIARSQPVRSLAAEAGTPGYRPVRVNSSVSGSGPGDRERLGLTGAGPKKIITDLGVLEPDPQTLEFTLTGLYPGVSASAAKERTGWDLAITTEPEIIAAPTPAELDALRGFQSREQGVTHDR